MSLRDALAELYSRLDADQHRERYAAVADLIADEEKRRVHKVGDQAPTFALTDPDLGSVSSSELLLRGPLIVNFYRGLWCSYCQQDLLGLEQIIPDIRKANASIVVITHGLEPIVLQRLRQSTNFGFPIVDDVTGEVAEQFGIRWAPEDASLIESALGADLVTLRGTGPWILPMQARYVIDRDGVIVFVNVAADYDQRSSRRRFYRFWPNSELPTNNGANVLTQRLREVGLINYDPDRFHPYAPSAPERAPVARISLRHHSRCPQADQSSARRRLARRIPAARLSLEAKVRHYEPRAIAFLGKRPFSIMAGRPDPTWDRQREEFADTTAWVLPNPSGRNWRFTLDALLKAYVSGDRWRNVGRSNPVEKANDFKSARF